MTQMSEILVVARLRVMTTDAQLQRYHDQVVELEPNQRGLKGFSFWRGLDADGGVLQLMRYTDSKVAEEALEALVTSKIGPLVQSVTIDPPDVVVVETHRKHGKNHDEAPNDSFATLSIRFSDPGMSEEQEQDTDEVLTNLAYVPGYLGAVWGTNLSMRDEVVSIAFWDSEQAMMESIPTSHRVRIHKWQKVV